MAGPRFTEKDIYELQKQDDRRWVICLTLAFMLHAACAGLLLFMPSIFDARMPVEEAVVVSITPPLPETSPNVGPPSTGPKPEQQKETPKKIESQPPKEAPEKVEQP